jgi:hypothetical protein
MTVIIMSRNELTRLRVLIAMLLTDASLSQTLRG